MANCVCKGCGRRMECTAEELCEVCEVPVENLQAGDERLEILQMADQVPEPPPLERNSYGGMVEVEEAPTLPECVECDGPCTWTPPTDRWARWHEESPGLTYDDGKPPLALIPKLPLELVADVFGKGASKYAMHNWRAGIQVSRNLSCALRHIYAYNEGEDLDPELGTNHLANAIVRLMFVIETAAKHPEMDDRWCPGSAAWIAELVTEPETPSVSEPAGLHGPLCLACGQPGRFEYVMPDGVTGHYYCWDCKFPRDYPMQGKTAYD